MEPEIYGTKTVEFLVDSEIDSLDGEGLQTYKAGQTYVLRRDKADRWIRRGRAKLVLGDPFADEEALRGDQPASMYGMVGTRVLDPTPYGTPLTADGLRGFSAPAGDAVTQIADPASPTRVTDDEIPEGFAPSHPVTTTTTTSPSADAVPTTSTGDAHGNEVAGAADVGGADGGGAVQRTVDVPRRGPGRPRGSGTRNRGQ